MACARSESKQASGRILARLFRILARLFPAASPISDFGLFFLSFFASSADAS